MDKIIEKIRKFSIMNKVLAIILLLLGIISTELNAREFYTTNNHYKIDTNFVFESPFPLFDPNQSVTKLLNSVGVNLSLSGHGFGLGTTMNWAVSDNLSFTANLMISGAKNTDEFEQWDYDKSEYRVPNKINRLYVVPITFGAKYNILSSVLSENVRPFINAAAGPTWILATPYDREFFNAFHYSQSYIRFGGYVGLGSDFGIGKSLLSLNFKQYFIPFGGDGLESVRNHPLTDFGGFQIELILGVRY